MALYVLAATDSKVIQSGYSWFRGVPGVRSYLNNECLHLQISNWIEYASGVKSETITPDRRVDLRCSWISSLSMEILGSILQVRLKYVSRVIGYDTATPYRWDSLSIPGWLEIYSDGSVSGESRCWERFSCPIARKLFSIIDSVNIPNSFAILLSGVPAIDSVSNGSNPLEWFQVRVGTGTELWQRFYHMKNPDRWRLGWFSPYISAFASPDISLELSIWVLIVSWHDKYVDCAVLAALSPPAFRFVIRPIFVESLSKTR